MIDIGSSAMTHMTHVHHTCTVGQNNQEYRLEYWATRSSICSVTRTAHSFACSSQLPLLARSLHSLPSSWLDGYLFCLFFTLAHSDMEGKQLFDSFLARRTRTWLAFFFLYLFFFLLFSTAVIRHIFRASEWSERVAPARAGTHRLWMMDGREYAIQI